MNEPPSTVTTEPQRQALDRMSAELTDKLNMMIAEQEQRVSEFAALHPHALPEEPERPEPILSAPFTGKGLAAPTRYKARPPLPTPEEPPRPTVSRTPAIPTKAAGEANKEGGRINAFTIIIMLLVVFFILSRCD